MDDIVYLNGDLVRRSQARISVSDHAFLYGYGLFETMRAYHGRIFRLERHLERLIDAAANIGLAAGLAEVDLARACRDTLKANGLEDARLRLTVSGGESDAFPWSDKSRTSNIVVTARPYEPLPEEAYRRGYRAMVASVCRGRSLVSGIKSTSYLVSVLARMEAAAAGLDEALLLNEAGFIAEGGGSNVFFVNASGLVTPSLESGILPGITREVVIEVAGELGIGVSEGDVSLADLEQFEEAFMTNSMIEVMPLVAIRERDGPEITIGSGKQGEVTSRLMSAYREKVVEDTGSSWPL